MDKSELDKEIEDFKRRSLELLKNPFVKKRLKNGAIKLLSKKENIELNKANAKKAAQFRRFKAEQEHFKRYVKLKFKKPPN
jgi:hypothetical protein